MLAELFLWIGILGISLFVLIKAAGYFTAAAEKIGLLLGISPFVVGVTLVSVGTSLPELITSMVAVFENSSEIVAGNVIGSNIANIFFILGIGAVIGKNLKIKFELLSVDLPLLLGSVFFLAVTTWDGIFKRSEALLFIGGFLIVTFYSIKGSAKNDVDQPPVRKKKPAFELKPFLVIIFSSLGIYAGAKYTVESIIIISQLLVIGKEVVAVSAVALGTSLPELFVTISAVRRNNAEIVVGNILGSNLFNTFAIMGFPGLFSTLKVPDSMVKIGLPFLVIATVLFVTVTQDRQVTRWEGWLFLLFYVLFVGKIFNFL